MALICLQLVVAVAAAVTADASGWRPGTAAGSASGGVERWAPADSGVVAWRRCAAAG